MKFKELDKRRESVIEDEITEYWEKINILEKSIDKNKDYFVFYDGPATANGMPGIHHLMAKFLKDAFCKYKTMKGYKVLRKVGWDTHGLPVELGVEKKVGFKNKTDIEAYGIEKFNEKCRESVWENERAFAEVTKKLGQFIDLKNPYITYKNDYIETEWWILKKYFEEGLIYEGHKILPYCHRCGTGLASHEVAQGYKEVSVETVTVLMKKKDEDVYFLVWTTTPWTLLANVALCVNPNEDYIKLVSKGNKFIIAKKLASKYFDDYEVLEEYKGKDLEGIEYDQLLPFIKTDKKAFFVTTDNYVTMEDGTGIVHIAPAFGEDDYNLGKRNDLPIINPVGEDGKYLEGPWKGTVVFDADVEVIKYLKEKGLLFKKEKIKHNYPHCWRCDTPLLYYSKPSWYIKITDYKDKIINENKKIEWYPSYIGEKRFGNWLENMNDWAISRSRYWGTPLPLWKCSCGHLEMIGSRKELVEKSIENITEDIELHRPYVDNVHLKCPKCGKEMTRVSDVIDCWFDSGSMPFAQYHYPFENKELFETQFPADFICEGVDQTRGWFYTLLVISTFVMGRSSYKRVLVNDLLLDKNGKKMSKSKGNAIDPFALIEEYGADTLRWYLPYVSPVWTPLKFDLDGLKEVHSKFFNPLKNTYNFFSIYANADNIDPRDFKLNYESLEIIDKWLLSKYNKLIKEVTEYYEEYDLNKVVKKITEFVSEELSNWYIRRNRNRFWASDKTESKMNVYKVTYDVLLGLSKIIAPIVPFLSEELYRNLTDEESVHLSTFPEYNDLMINEEIEEKMDKIRMLISMGRNLREEAKIKVRQPLSEVILDSKNEELLGDLVNLIYEELNVKKVTFATNLKDFMNYVIKPNFKVAGPMLGKNIGKFKNELLNLSEEEKDKLVNNEEITLDIDGKINVTSDMIEVSVEALEGFNTLSEDNEFVILNTNLTEDLILEGLAREFVSKIQNLRKERDYNITDRIKIYYEDNAEFEKVLSSFEDYIKGETLAVEITKKYTLAEELKINDLKVFVDIEKVS